MNQSKFNLGVVLRDSLNKLRYDPDQEGDYELVGRFVDGQNYIDINSPDEITNSLDAVIFMHYPFNKNLAKIFSEKESDVFFLNSPSGVLNTSEKTFEHFNFSKYMPESLYINKDVSDENILEFFNSYESVIVKPINGTGGKGIDLYKKGSELPDLISKYKSENYIAQEFIKNEGDKRILCLGGDILGYFGRFNDSNYINNISSGGSMISVDLSKEEVDMALDISNRLVKEGIYFSGLDVIDGKLIEVNTASPGGIDVVEPYKFKSKDNMYDYAKRKVYDLFKK
ncbi:MAG: hypothetical protein ACMXX9_03405 [Candidatus Woesearchaeota archaeon]